MRIAFASVLFLLFGAACGDEDHGHADLDAEACEHLTGPDATAVTASATADGAPEVSDDHMRYDIALVDVGGERGGFVQFASGEATDLVLFLDEDVPVAVTDSGGQEVAIEESATTSDSCAAVRGRHVVPFGVGTYVIELGPTSVEEVGLVMEELAHEH